MCKTSSARVTPTSISLLVLHMCTHDSTDTRDTTVYTVYRDTSEVVTALAGLEDQYRLRPQVKVDEVPAGKCGARQARAAARQARGRLAQRTHSGHCVKPQSSPRPDEGTRRPSAPNERSGRHAINWVRKERKGDRRWIHRAKSTEHPAACGRVWRVGVWGLRRLCHATLTRRDAWSRALHANRSWCR